MIVPQHGFCKELPLGQPGSSAILGGLQPQLVCPLTAAAADTWKCPVKAGEWSAQPESGLFEGKQLMYFFRLKCVKVSENPQMWLPGISNVLGSNASPKYYDLSSTLNVSLQPLVWSCGSGRGREAVSTEKPFLWFISFMRADTSRAHMVQLLLCTCKKHYALSRLLSSERSPCLILRLRCQLDIFLLCLLPVWIEINRKRWC